MGSIKEEVRLVGALRSKDITALFDTGAYRNYIKRELSDGEQVDSIGFHIYEGRHTAILADGSESEGERVGFRELRIRNIIIKEPRFVVMENLIEDMILGIHLMQAHSISLNPYSETIEIGS